MLIPEKKMIEKPYIRARDTPKYLQSILNLSPLNVINNMDAIFHEKQEGSLCAQHCLNTLLQGQYFSAVDLADIAQQLDESERQQMAEAGVQSDEYQKFLQQASSNFDDSGFFSIQVIDKALQVWGLNLIQFNSQHQIAQESRAAPVQQSAYICNFRDHWFAIRKIGHQWFNLNSLLTGPELISDTYLSLFLTQLQQEGYSIFIVTGRLPECEADELLKLIPAVQTIKPRLINENQAISKSDESADPEYHQAIAESRNLDEQDDKMLQKALQMSMEGYVIEDIEVPNTNQPSTSSQTANTESSQKSKSEPEPVKPSQEELRLKRQAFLSKLEMSSSQTCDNSDNVEQNNRQQSKTITTPDIAPSDPAVPVESHDTGEMDSGQENDDISNNADPSEEEMLQQAIALSMEGQV